MSNDSTEPMQLNYAGWNFSSTYWDHNDGRTDWRLGKSAIRQSSESPADTYRENMIDGIHAVQGEVLRDSDKLNQLLSYRALH